MNPVFITARRWQDSKGNTYHSVRVYFDNGDAHTRSHEYGYGDAWIKTAKNILITNGCTTDFNFAFSEVVDVARERDLHFRE